MEVTDGRELVAPSVLPYEVGNALSAMVKRSVILPAEVPAVWDAIAAVPVELAEIDIAAAIVLAVDSGVYAYDAYFVRCAIETGCPLLTLDQGMKRLASRLNVKLLEQP